MKFCSVSDEFHQFLIHKLVFVWNVKRIDWRKIKMSKGPKNPRLVFLLHHQNQICPVDILVGYLVPALRSNADRSYIDPLVFGVQAFRCWATPLVTTANEKYVWLVYHYLRIK